ADRRDEIMSSRLDRSPVAVWWRTVDRWFLAAFLSLMGLGIVLSFAASPAVAVMIAVSFLQAREVRRMALIMLCISLVLMVAVLYVGVEVKGARRWVSFAGVSVQPSEFLK